MCSEVLRTSGGADAPAVVALRAPLRQTQRLFGLRLSCLDKPRAKQMIELYYASRDACRSGILAGVALDPLPGVRGVGEVVISAASVM